MIPPSQVRFWILITSSFAITAAMAGEPSVQDLKESLRNDFWVQHNSHIFVYWRNQVGSYREADMSGRTTDGVLDTETVRCCKGSTGLGLQLRWQGSASKLPLWMQAQTYSMDGKSEYYGYLQRGNALEPYSAKTKNHWEAATISIGIPLAINHAFGLPMKMQFIPTIQWQRRVWRRELTQYVEKYVSTNQFYGAVVQLNFFQIAPSDLVLHASWQGATHSKDVVVEVQSLGFRGRQSIQRTSSSEMALSYRLSPSWNFQIAAQKNLEYLAASQVVNALQSPSSKTAARQIWLGLAFHY